MKTPLALPCSLALVAVFACAAHAQPGPDEGLKIGDASGLDEDGNLHEHWLPFTSSGMRLESEDFYRRVGRPDLAGAHSQRKWIAIAALTGGLAVTGATLVYAASSASGPAQMTCNINSSFSQFSNCVSANSAAIQSQAAAMQSAMPWIIGGSLLGAAALGVAAWYFSNPEPIDEAEAQQLVADHNANLRAVRVTPYAGPAGGGVSVGGAF